MSIGFNLNSTAALAPNKRLIKSFEALKAGVDFFLSIKIFQYEAILSILKIYYLV